MIGSLGAHVALVVLLAPLVLAPSRSAARVENPAPIEPISFTTAPVPVTAALGGGRLELQRTWLHGVPVRGAFELTVRGPDERPRVLLSRTVAGTPQLRPEQARVDVAGLRAAIVRATGDEAEPERPPQLVYRVVQGEAVLAWEVQLPLTLTTRREPSRRTLWLSADSGELVDERENVLSSRARVFPENPSATPTPIEVTLDEIDAAGPGVPLVGPHLRSLNCVTVPPAVVEPWHDEGDCWAVARTFSDAAGDFFVPLPDVIDPAQGVDGNDLYAELAMYVHGERFLAYMGERGLIGYRCELSTMLANVRGIEPTDEHPYTPLDNAYFTDQCDPELGPTMLFGQGSEVDFAFDADVIYHELGHGVVAQLAPEGLNRAATRSDGVTPDANAINEALADYISTMLTEDPELAEYVGRFWVAQDVPWIRTALNRTRCPDDLIGESHADGEPLMAALWSTRVRVGRALDDVVLRALTRMPPDVTLELATQILVGVARELQGDGRLEADDVAVLERELVARNLDDCPRVITDPVQVAAGRTMFLRRTSATVAPFWPGPMQLRHVVPDAGGDVVVSFELNARGGGDDPITAKVLVKRGDDTPIAFEYSLAARDTDGDPSGGSGKIRELTLVEGDWELAVEAVRVAGNLHEAVILGLRPGEVVHLALVDTATVDALATNVRVLATDPADVPGDGPDDDEDSERDTDEPEQVVGDDPQASCACDAHAAPPALGWLIVAAGRRRRRRRC
ncbi:MAG: hypothetical protein IAG13_30790 [Deltaproteobacteria bacterium]|nr:hypothetical protein [Nannocystaceae bacterium]